jgi:hypothetical protein
MFEGVPRDSLAFASFADSLSDNICRVDAAHSRPEKRRALAKFHAENRKSLETLEKLNRSTRRFLGQLRRRMLTPQELKSIFDIALEKRKYEQDVMAPKVNELRHKLQDYATIWDKDALLCLQESVDITAKWMEIHEKLTKNILEIAEKRRVSAAKALRARPLQGEVDHDALSREFMARFPKLRAALAK